MSQTPFEGGDRVFEVGYRPITERGKRQPPAVAIARTMLTLAWRQRATKIVLLVCLAVLGGHGVWLVGQLLFERFGADLGGAGVPVGELVGSTREVLANFLRVQFFTTAIAVAVIAVERLLDLVGLLVVLVATIPSWVALYRVEALIIWLGLGLGALLVSYFMYNTLVYYSGAIPAEFYSVQKRPAFADYQRRTSRFFPRAPGR